MTAVPIKSGHLAGRIGHNFRQAGYLSASIDASLSHRNRTLVECDPAFVIPTMQPNGRKIRTDARIGLDMVMTLPKELDESRLEEWIEASMNWWNTLPGKPHHAVLHRDEPGARSHIHAIRIPIDKDGHLNYKRYFGGHCSRFDEMQQSYALALEHLGVYMSHEDDRKSRRSARRDPEKPSPTEQRRRPRTREREVPRADLEEMNRHLRQSLKNSGIAKQADYKALAEIKRSDLPLDEKLRRMAEHVDRVLGRDSPSPNTPMIADELNTWQAEVKAQIEKTKVALMLTEYDAAKDYRERFNMEKKCRPYLDVIQDLPEAKVKRLNAHLSEVGKELRQMQHKRQSGPAEATPRSSAVQMAPLAAMPNTGATKMAMPSGRRSSKKKEESSAGKGKKWRMFDDDEDRDPAD